MVEDLYSLIQKQISGNPRITEDTLLIEDLHFDSLSLMQLIIDIESAYDISFDDGNLLFDNFNRVGDLRNIIDELRKANYEH